MGKLDGVTAGLLATTRAFSEDDASLGSAAAWLSTAETPKAVQNLIASGGLYLIPEAYIEIRTEAL